LSFKEEEMGCACSMLGKMATAKNILVRKVYGKRKRNAFCNREEDITEVHKSKLTHETVE
jgi:hypothetical protein